jgi:hypothetical protein
MTNISLQRFEILNFGHCDLFDICVLLFVIWSCKNHCKSVPVRFYENEIAVMLLVVLVVVLVIVLGFSSN